MGSIYSLLPDDECFSKSYRDHFETYKSHINACLSFVRPVMSAHKSGYSFDYVEDMVRLHDIGKRGVEFQKSIRKEKAQEIRHEELAFILWLDNHPDLRCLREPQILAILAHHRTLLDETSAVEIEKYISEHENMGELSRRWIEVLKTPRKGRIDTELLLPTLKLVDILRTIDLLASYTTETVLHLSLNLEISDSLFASAYTRLSRELSSINLRADEIAFKDIDNNEKTIRIQITKPIESVAEYIRRELK